MNANPWHDDSKALLSSAPCRRNFPILKCPIFLILGHLRKAKSFRLCARLKSTLEVSCVYTSFLHMKFHNPNVLEAVWNEGSDLSRIGLYYDRSIPLANQKLEFCQNQRLRSIHKKPLHEKTTTLSARELLSLFEQRLKMDWKIKRLTSFFDLILLKGDP